MNKKGIISAKEANEVARKTQDHLVCCPCCSRWVNKIDARSIFDFKVKICKRCAEAEKGNSYFNWILETKVLEEKDESI